LASLEDGRGMGEIGVTNTLGKGEEEWCGELTIETGKKGRELWRSVLGCRFDSFVTLCCMF
jgi:hypothetical protein